MITARDRLALIATSLAMTGGSFRPAQAVAEPSDAAASSSADLEAGWDALYAAIGKASDFVRSHPFYRDPQNRTSAYSLIVAVLLTVLEMRVVYDPDFPIFHIHDQRIHAAGDNPDQRYSISRIRGGETYRIWGHLRGERRLDVQVYAGNPFVPHQGRSASFLTFEDIHFDPDGAFEIMLSPNHQGRNWIANPPDGSQVMVRQIFSDWDKETPGEAHIDRVGMEGALKPVLTQAAMGQRLREAGDELLLELAAWPGLLQANFGRPDIPVPINTVPPPFDTSPQGGVKGRYMTFTLFDLAEDEALIVRTWPMGTNYQSIQLQDMWTSDLEYGNRQTSLTTDQAHRASDGSYWFVVCGRDPGVQNWLDTVGLTRGLITFRFDGMNGRAFDPSKAPHASKVKFDEILAALPADTPRVESAGRNRAIAARRRHLHQRCHD
jgi:hypothetical protein